ncbi:argininosuccinate lyase-like [Penaeus japonicus]|uniref:argininosuccinate lyase-like n=1 Tax=Penaeus japonicus TaxID=27405 RepID=UPI001C70F326|nr:argininosuccinate lyase-like [Penaeus japonicus]XP_042862648.1 argininosuccinate lyase-like [Penaeus japonicus]XP_042862649.1 argininosuccinate lyase-like [Penaeus japonicus]XP_042862650.1 argininosuccinate lyase-like [Penaeus japonicus]
MGSEAENVKLWGGRFSGSTDPVMEKFNASLPFDKIMWKQDIQGSIAYAKALQRANLLTEAECNTIIEGLEAVHSEWAQEIFETQPQDEDIHTANERRLKELVGEVGGKVHTGRSRNDQVAVDMKLWLQEHLTEIADHLAVLARVLVERADREKTILMPGYTHLQRAQPIRWSHLLLSHAWPLLTDLERLKQLYSRVNVCPLGSGALAGNPFSIDREQLAQDLGFRGITQNSLQAVSDRDYVVEFLFWSSMVGSHLSRLAEDVILYSTSEFGYIKLSDAYATGSSLMPQKKNPDSMELIRGKAGTLAGNLCGFLMVLKGLPSTYNKDLQEDKLKMFETASVMKGLLQVAAGAVQTMKVDASACQKGLTEEMLATDVAYYLVKKGMAFRTAHGKAGEVVKLAEELGCPFSKIPLIELSKISPLFAEDVSSVWNFEHSVEQYEAVGGTALSSVNVQITNATAFLDNYSVAGEEASVVSA